MKKVIAGIFTIGLVVDLFAGMSSDMAYVYGRDIGKSYKHVSERIVMTPSGGMTKEKPSPSSYCEREATIRYSGTLARYAYKGCLQTAY